MPYDSKAFARDDAINDLFLKLSSTLEVLVSKTGVTRADVDDILNDRVQIPIDGVIFPPFPPDRPFNPDDI